MAREGQRGKGRHLACLFHFLAYSKRYRPYWFTFPLIALLIFSPNGPIGYAKGFSCSWMVSIFWSAEKSKFIYRPRYARAQATGASLCQDNCRPVRWYEPPQVYAVDAENK